MNFSDLVIDKDYYCSDSNYYSNNAGDTWETWSDFYNEYKDADIDMNLIFRFDIKENDDKSFYAEVFIMHQRKGIFAPHYIRHLSENDTKEIIEIMQRHYNKIQSLWSPFSNNPK